MAPKIAGKYFGTEIDEKWWKRYRKNKMFARGNGTFSYDDLAISFLRLLTKHPIVIEFEKINEIKIGKWHSGQWGARRPIIKILWECDNQLLSSGFSISNTSDDFDDFVAILKNRVKN